MKWIYLLTIVFLVQTNSHSQNLTAVRTASLMDGDYTLSGTVYLEAFDDGSLDLRFDNNYLTQSNVYDVHVFLTNNNNYYNAPIDTTGMLLVANIGTISGLDYSSGARTFQLPSGVGINDYQYIVFICVQYGRLHWGDGTFSTAVTTGIEQTMAMEELSVDIYPNPSESGNLTIELEDTQEQVLFQVLDINGRLLYEEQVLNRRYHTIHLSESGVYFLKIRARNRITTRKVVKT